LETPGFEGNGYSFPSKRKTKAAGNAHLFEHFPPLYFAAPSVPTAGKHIGFLQNTDVF